MNLDRLHGEQVQTNIALRQQGAALQDLARTQREIATIQLETVKAIKRLGQERSTPPAKSAPFSKLTASDAMQWAAAVGMLLYVVRGGDVTPFLKALFGG